MSLRSVLRYLKEVNAYVLIYCLVYLEGAVTLYVSLLYNGITTFQESRVLLGLLVYNVITLLALCQQAHLLYTKPEKKGAGVSMFFFGYLAGCIVIQLAYEYSNRDYGLLYLSLVRGLPYGAITLALVYYRRVPGVFLLLWLCLAWWSFWLSDYYLDKTFLLSQFGISATALAQLFKLWKDKSKGTLAGFNVVMFAITGLFWTAYGYERGDNNVLYSSALAATVNIAIFLLWWRYPQLESHQTQTKPAEQPA